MSRAKWLLGFIFFCAGLMYPAAKGSRAQYFYVNSYADANSLGTLNCTYKIDLESAMVIDSVYFQNRGEFLNKEPIPFQLQNNRWLIAFMATGQAGKNSVIGGVTSTLYTVINEQNFEVVAEDSLPGILVFPNILLKDDSLHIEWLEDTHSWQGRFRGVLNLERDRRRLHVDSRRVVNENDESLYVIGEYSNPTLMYSDQQSRFYWVQYQGSLVVIFQTDLLNNILQEMTLGDCRESSFLIGYDESSGNIYVFAFRFSLTTYSPPIVSPDSIRNRVLIINAMDFSNRDEFSPSSETPEISNEVGTVDLIDHLFVYYFFEGEDYRSFRPAMLFIFDTRTNEATWVRVGWR